MYLIRLYLTLILKPCCSYHEESVRPIVAAPSSAINTSDTGSVQSTENVQTLNNVQMPNSVLSNRLLADFTVEMEGTDLVVPRNVDRILEQFILMMLKIGTFLNKKGIDPVALLSSSSLPELQPPENNGNDNNISFPSIYTEPPQDVAGNTNVCTATSTYMKKYPEIFDKKKTDSGLNLYNTDQTDTMLPVVDKSTSVATNMNSKLSQSKNYTANRRTLRSSSKATDESALKPKDSCSYDRNPTSSMCHSAGNIRNANTVTTTRITKTKSIAISLPSSETPRTSTEKKEHRNKNNITVNSPSSTQSKTDVTVTREDSHESNLSESSGPKGMR